VFEPWWIFLNKMGVISPIGDFKIFIVYPTLAWSGIVTLGYVFGMFYRWEASRRAVLLKRLGVASVALFLLLRWTSVYGNPSPWNSEAPAWKAALRFLDCHKYPPSLLYTLMTLGPSMFLLAWFEKLDWKGWLSPLVTFGRVPMFYFILHLFLTHGLARLMGMKFGLWGIYGMWIAIVFLLYWPCRWFAELKQRRRDVWLGYF